MIDPKTGKVTFDATKTMSYTPEVEKAVDPIIKNINKGGY